MFEQMANAIGILTATEIGTHIENRSRERPYHGFHTNAVATLFQPSVPLEHAFTTPTTVFNPINIARD